MAEPETVPEHAIAPLAPSSLTFGVHAYQQLNIEPEADTPIEHIERSEYWAFVAAKLEEGAEIRILPKGMAYRAEALVTFCDKYNVRVKIISYTQLIGDDQVELTVVPPPASKNYKLLMRGVNKWCVQRLSDGEWIKERIPTKNEAVVWLEKYLLSVDGDDEASLWLASQDY